MTSAARTLVGDRVHTEPLGAHRLKDFPAPELLFCAVVDGRGAAFFPPPRTQRVRPTNLPAGMPDLLDAAPELRVLVTSQAPLRVARERCLGVDSLDEEAAIELIERVARRRNTSFQLADHDRAATAEIIALLDGLPLALELAAARLSVLTPAQLRDKLRSSSDVLRNDMRDGTDRHRSLRSTVQWSLESLEEPARQMFVRMGAFAGPVELDELEAVAGSRRSRRARGTVCPS